MTAHTDQTLTAPQPDSVGVGAPPASSDQDPVDTHSRRVAAGGLSSAPPPASQVASPKPGSRVAEYDARNGEITFLAETLNDIEALRTATGNRVWQLEHGALAGLTGANLATATNLADALKAVETSVVRDLERAMKRHPLGAWLKSAPGVGPKQGPRLLAAIGNPYWNARDGRPRRGPAELWAYCGYHVLPASQRANEAHGVSAGGHPLATDQMCGDTQSTTVGGQPLPASQTLNKAQNQHAGGHPLATDQIAGDTPMAIVGGQFLHPNDHSLADTQKGNVVGVAPRRAKGQLANWSSQARSRAWLIANSCVQQPAGTRYRDIYDTGRAKYANAAHTTTCERCSACANCGNPLTKTKRDHLADHGCADRRAAYAGPGSPLTPAHQHARALRLIAKTVLRDIYVEAKAWHEQEEVAS